MPLGVEVLVAVPVGVPETLGVLVIVGESDVLPVTVEVAVEVTLTVPLIVTVPVALPVAVALAV